MDAGAGTLGRTNQIGEGERTYNVGFTVYSYSYGYLLTLKPRLMSWVNIVAIGQVHHG